MTEHRRVPAAAAGLRVVATFRAAASGRHLRRRRARGPAGRDAAGRGATSCASRSRRRPASLDVPGLEHAGRGGARRPRHPAALRRLPRRPDARPGLRARPGAVLRDGRAPARHRRPAGRDVRRGRRWRATSTCGPWAGGGSPSRSSRWSRRRPATRWRRTPTASTPTSTATPPARSRWSTPCSTPAASATSPEPWTPVDSLAWLKAMAWDLRGNMTDEIDRALALDEHTAAQVAELYPPYDADAHAPIVGQGAVVDGVFEQDATAPGTRNPTRPAYTAEPAGRPRPARAPGVDAMPPLLGHGDGLGSNSWVVDGDHTDTGAPLLANDPHLGVSLPGVWMQMGLHCRELTEDCPLDVAGFTFSGVPGCDHRPQRRHRLGLHQPRPRRQRPLPRAGRRRPVALRRPAGCRCAPARETIKVARRRRRDDHRPVHRRTARCSPTSPTRSPTSGARPAAGSRSGELRGRAAVDRAAARRRPPTRSSSSTWRPTGTRFRAAASSFAVPAQNLVYADREGHIGYQAPGRIPIRKSGNDGLLPSAGWKPENDWTGDYVPFDGLPSVLDPDGGVRRHRQPGGDRPGLPLLPHRRLGPRLPVAADPRAARSSSSTATARSRWPTCSPSSSTTVHPLAAVLTPYLLGVDLPDGYYSAGQRAAARLGLPPGRRQRGRGVLQRRVAQPAAR